MQNSSDLFKTLPEDLKKNIAGYLSLSELNKLSKTSRGNLRLFKSVVDVSELLQDVVQGNHEAVQLRLEKDISLIWGRGKIMDCSGRTFENISAFEYALWSLDKHMWTRMIKGIPLNKEGEKIFAKLLFQYDSVNVKGVTYKLNGKGVTEKHFDFENTIINALQTHLDLRNAAVVDWKNIDKQWEAVGESQKLLPRHVIYEYCSREPFHPMPEFTRQPESSMQILNRATGKLEHWFAADSIASTYFAILKGWGGAERRAMLPSHWLRIGSVTAEYPKQDLDALRALYKVRLEDFINLKAQLSQNPSGLRNALPTRWIVNRVRKMKEVIVTHCNLK